MSFFSLIKGFLAFLACFKISFSSLHNPSHEVRELMFCWCGEFSVHCTGAVMWLLSIDYSVR